MTKEPEKSFIEKVKYYYSKSSLWVGANPDGALAIILLLCLFHITRTF